MSEPKLTVLDRLGRSMDQLISVVAPRSALQRSIARERVRALRATYAAAKTNRMTGSWSTTSTNINDILTSDLATVRNRIRQLVRDFPVFQNTLNKMVDYTVGAGMQFQMKIKKRDGTLNDTQNSRVEDAWHRWAENPMISGRMHLDEVARLAARGQFETGEFLLVKRFDMERSARGENPFRLQIVEPEWLSSIGAKSIPKNHDFSMGVEYDKTTGKIIAYHMSDPNNFLASSPTVVPAKDVIHGFDTVRPGQVRGMSPLVAAVLLADSMNEYIGAEVDSAKLMSKYFAFIQTPNIPDFQGRRPTDTDEDDSTKKIDDVEAGIVEYLNPGEEINFNIASKNGTQFDKFTDAVMRMLAIVSGISYEIIAGDYRGLNFTTIRGARNDMLQTIRPRQRQFIHNFYQPIFEDFLLTGSLNRSVIVPGFDRDPVKVFQAAKFIAPGLPSVDPLRESKANIEDINNLLRSPQEIAAERGADIEEVLDEFVSWQSMLDSRDLEVIANAKLDAQTNPARVTGNEEED